jgi:hypothetical protein
MVAPKLTLSGTRRPSNTAMQIAYAVACILILATLAFSAISMAMPSATPLNPTLPKPRTSAPLEYRIPSEPVDYYDPNYIGSYGG